MTSIKLITSSRFDLNKERLEGLSNQLKFIRYGPFNIFGKVSEKAFELNLPTYIYIYSIINVEN